METRWNRYQEQAQNLHARAQRLTESIVAEARRTALAAGLDPTICFLHASNASASAHYGKPWPEVNMSLVRRVLWLEQKSFEPGRIVGRILDRSYHAAINAERGSEVLS